ncbi:MAG: hypothetical protein ABI885_26150 [Gammaproteobacteria bacterium]
MTFCEEFLVELPDTFPYLEWQTFFNVGRPWTQPDNEAAGEFVRAMQASAYRYRTADEAVLSMITVWRDGGQVLSFEAMYRQQRDLFEFFSSTVSSIESALYACYVALTQRHPATAPWGNLNGRKGHFDQGLPRLLNTAYLGTSPLEAVVDALARSADWKEAKEYRNSMIHRALPSRLIEATMGGPPPPVLMVKYAKSWSTLELRATELQMQGRLGWASSQLKLIYEGAGSL